jgi:hypothetical protein
MVTKPRFHRVLQLRSLETRISGHFLKLLGKITPDLGIHYCLEK